MSFLSSFFFIEKSKNKPPEPVAMKCSKCSEETFTSIHDFDDHTFKCHGPITNGAQFNCKICHSNWSCAEVLHFHLYSEHQSGQSVCDICGAMLTSKYYIKRHKDAEHFKIKNFQCDRCEKIFAEKTQLKKHMDSVHLGIKRIKCQFCDYGCNAKSLLLIHIERKHTKNPEFRCKHCDFVTPSYKALCKHTTKIHAPNKSRKFQSEIVISQKSMP